MLLSSENVTLIIKLICPPIDMGFERSTPGVIWAGFGAVRRLLAAYRKDVLRLSFSLKDGNRGRKPHHALDKGLWMQVLELTQLTHAGCNTQHLTKLHAEREGIAICRSSVHRTLHELCTMIATAYLSTVRASRSQWRNNLKGEGNQLNLAG